MAPSCQGPLCRTGLKSSSPRNRRDGRIPFFLPQHTLAGTSARGKFPDGRRQNLSSESGTGSTLRRAGGLFSKTCTTAAKPGRTARISRKTGSHTAVIWGITRTASSIGGSSEFVDQHPSSDYVHTFFLRGFPYQGERVAPSESVP